jgi:dihydrofolate reductase
MTMKLTITTNITVDGVMQGLGGPEEDVTGGFERGGWAIPLFDAEASEHLDRVYGGASAFLFGRRTFDIFAGSWGVTDPASSPIAGALNGRPKYVASSTLHDPDWADSTVLSGDIAAAVRELKATGEGELVVPGSGQLARWLMAERLVDELDLSIYPIVLGQGTRLFPQQGLDAALELLSSRTTSGGITIQSYRFAGRPEYQRTTVMPADLL